MDVLSEYQKELSKDLVLNDFNIKDQQLKLPGRKHYWVTRLINAKVEKNKLIQKKKKLKKDVVRQVIADSPVKISAAAAEAAANNHSSISDIDQQIYNLMNIIEYLEKVEKIMSQMSFDIKNVVEIMKLEQL